MDMPTTTSAMSSMIMNMTAGSTAAATTSMMSSSMDMGGGCKINMLWNWYTIDACFISSSWRIRSNGVFAGSCIGVILLVMSLEFLRRLSKEYDRYILRASQKQRSTALSDEGASPGQSLVSPTQKHIEASDREIESIGSSSEVAGCEPTRNNKLMRTFKPSLLQQAIRATLHMVQFAVAYFIMLLAMYYNGYIIMCIIIGAWLGAFVFSWETISLGDDKQETTFCCG